MSKTWRISRNSPPDPEHGGCRSTLPSSDALAARSKRACWAVTRTKSPKVRTFNRAGCKDKGPASNRKKVFFPLLSVFPSVGVASATICANRFGRVQFCIREKGQTSRDRAYHCHTSGRKRSPKRRKETFFEIFGWLMERAAPFPSRSARNLREHYMHCCQNQQRRPLVPVSC
jgi:hypothetical protein